jgi:hypothetical protein
MTEAEQTENLWESGTLVLVFEDGSIAYPTNSLAGELPGSIHILAQNPNTFQAKDLLGLEVNLYQISEQGVKAMNWENVKPELLPGIFATPDGKLAIVPTSDPSSKEPGDWFGNDADGRVIYHHPFIITHIPPISNNKEVSVESN